MASRDLTRKFQALRTNARARVERRPINAPLPTATVDQPLTETETSIAPPEWVEIVATVKADVKTIKENLQSLHTLHKQRLQVSFDNASVQEQEQAIEILTQQITKLLRKNETALKRVAMSDSKTGLQLTSQERTTRINVMRTLAVELQEHSKAFRTAQRNFLNTLKKQGQLDEKFDFLPASADELNEAQRQQLDEMDRDATARYHAIVQIAKNVTELHELFKSLNVLVIEQGSILDRIDYNLEQTLVHVQSGTKELVKANEISKKAYSFKCLVFFAIVVLILLIALIVKKSSN